MAEIMYAPTDDLTLMAMFPYLRVSMDHITRMGTRFTTKAKRLGDISVRALYSLLGDVRKNRHRLLFNAGLSFPTRGIDEKDDTLGNRYQLGAWVSRKWTDWLSSSVRIDEHIWGNIHGADPDLNATLVPTADPDRPGKEPIDLSLGINLYVPRGFFKGVRLGLEYGFPLYESLDVPQLETDWHVGVGESLT